MTRSAVGVLGLLYLLQATWLLEGGVDLLFPRFQEVQSTGSSCCRSACGCPEDVKARKSCCCVPSPKTSGESRAAEEVPRRVPVSALEEARCKGVQEAFLQLFSQPALPAPIGRIPEVGVSRPYTISEVRPEFKSFISVLDKVPL